MDKPYMMLSNVPYNKAPSTVKKRFNALTLGPSKPDPPGTSVSTQRQLFGPDDSRLTDDDDDEEDHHHHHLDETLDNDDEEKENRIFNQTESPERVDLVAVHIKQRYSEAVTTLTEEMDIQMSKLELSLTQEGPLTDDQKLSEPLFHTESTEDRPGSPPGAVAIKEELNSSQQDTIISQDSVVTISSTNTSAIHGQGDEEERGDLEMEQEEEIIILDDDDEEEEEHRDQEPDDTHFSASLPSKSSEPNCSAPYSGQERGSLLTSSVMRKLSDFFNKIPDYEEPSPLAAHRGAAEPMESDLTIPETPEQSPESNHSSLAKRETNAPEAEISLISSTEDNSVIENSQEEINSPRAPSPAPPPTPPLPDSARKNPHKQKVPSQEINIRSQVGDGMEVINISAKIKVDIVIRTQEPSSSEEEEEEEEGEDYPDDDHPVTNVKPEKDTEEIVIKEEKKTPPQEAGTGSTEDDDDGDEFFDPENSATADKNNRYSKTTNDDDTCELPRRTSLEIAEMDTQSNSPRLPVVVHPFTRFEDTPKGRQERRAKTPVAEMDTILNSTSGQPSRHIAEMDTEVNTGLEYQVVQEQDEEEERDEEDAPAAESIVLDEESIAILHSIYGDNWRTPQLMRSMKRTPSVDAGDDSSFHANMTDFQKFNANIRRDLESTRTEKRSTNPPPLHPLPKTKSVEMPAKTPVKIFKTPSLVVQSPYFSNKKPKPTTPAINQRTPLKATPKYKKILQVVDTDSEEEEEEEEPVADSDDSFKIASSSSSSEDSESSSSSSSSSAGGGRRYRGKGAAAGGGGAVSKKAPKAQREANKKKRSSSTSRKGFDFTQIASSDSELDETIFIDKEKTDVRPILVVKKETDECSIEDQSGGKRKLFSDLNYQTPTSSVSSPEEEEERKENKKPTDKGTAKKQQQQQKEQEIRFPWLHDFTPVRHKTVERLKGVSSELTPKSVGKCGFLSSLDTKIGRGIADPVAVVFREQYKQKKEELAERLFKLFNEKVFEGALQKVPVKWNKKLLTTAGRCVNMARLGQRSAEVELSEKVLTSADRLRCTLIHEMCHAAAWIVDAEKKGHAGHWRKWTDRAVRALPELPKITVRHDYNIEYKYTYQCTKCKAKTQMHSKTKKAENIRCRFCHGDIEILLNKKTKTGEVVKTPVRAASGFALFVKENYKKLKQPQLKHADVMKLLSQNFAEMKVAGGGGVAKGDAAEQV